MNILIINFEYPPLGGGGGVATADIARELAKRHTVHVLTTAFHGLPKNEVIENIHIHRVPVWGRTSLPTATLRSLFTFAPAAFFAGISLMRSISFHVLYAPFVVPSGLPATLLSKLFRIPFVVTFIGGDVYDPSKGISPHRNIFFRIIIRWIAKAASARTAISHDTKTRTIELHGVRQPITVVPIGLRVREGIPSASRKDFDIPVQAIVAVSIGRLVPRKGYDVLLSAWRKVPEATLVIIGDGPMKEGLQQKIRDYNLQGRVHLMGQVGEIQKNQLLSLADMYVSAAQHEGFGIVFLEAMQAGLPIIAANDGGQRDFLVSGENALLVAPHDQKGLQEAIVKLLENPVLRQTMGRRNKEDVARYYIEHTAKRIEDILIRSSTLGL